MGRGWAGLLHLVRLQVPDETPADVGRQFRRLIQQLLHVVLPEHSVAAVVRSLLHSKASQCHLSAPNWHRLTWTSEAGLSFDTATSRTQRPAAEAAASTRVAADWGKGGGVMGVQ